MPPGRFREAAVTVTVTGAVCGCTYTFADLRATETVGGLKRQIQAKCGMPRFQQRLLLGARALDDDVILASLEPPLHLSRGALQRGRGDERVRRVCDLDK